MIKFARKVFLKLFKKYISRAQLKGLKGSGKTIKLIIGSGQTVYKGWTMTDIETLNITRDSDWNKLFDPNSISLVMAEHVFEHLTAEDRDKALSNIFTHLKKGGSFRIAVPDGFTPNKDYIEQVKPGGIGCGAYDHKYLYNYQDLSKILERIGFQPNLLEYYDEAGKFHLNPWSSDKGVILRSALNDKRNQHGKLGYTSLIIDAVKN